MTADLSGRESPDSDEGSWWDRHGWDYPTGAAAPSDTAFADAAFADAAVAEGEQSLPWHGDADAPGGLAWSRVATVFLVAGTPLTLPMIGLAGGYGRILGPAIWALLGLALSLLLTGREPVWDLNRPRRAEPLLSWAAAYLLGLFVGLNVPGLNGAVWFWIPMTLFAAIAPLVLARLRPSVSDGRGGS